MPCTTARGYAALSRLAVRESSVPKGGVVLAYDALIDDQRRENAFGLLFSLNMLIENQEGAEYTGADCQGWMRDVGFKDTYVKLLVGPDSHGGGDKVTRALVVALVNP